MGSKGANTTTGSFSPPKEFMQAYKESLSMARDAVSQPYQQYQGNLVAGLNPTQKQGIANVNAAQGAALPYIQQGAQYTQQAAQGITPELYQRFYSPYVQDVANATQANLLESNAQQLSGLKGGAINAGAFGGDRSGIAAAELGRQQNLAMGQTMSGIYNQGYNQAMGLAGQQVANMGTMGQQMAGLGTTAQSSMLQGAQAQMAAGAQQQATQQAQLQSAYEQWMQAQAYPYQQAQFFANIAQGLGAGAGGTSSTTGPSPNMFSQIMGGLGAIGSIASDARLKENIEPVGKLNDGQTIYRYNFKGDPKTQIGLLAQEVEGHKPEAVNEVGGLKMVNYHDATDDAAQMSSSGGVVGGHMGRAGFAGGGVPFFPYGEAPSYYVPEGKINVRGSNMPSPPDPDKDKGLSDEWDSLHPFTKSQLTGLGKVYDGLGLPSKEEIKGIFAPKDKEVAYVSMSDPGYSGGYGLATGGVAGRKHFEDGGADTTADDSDASEGLGAAPAPTAAPASATSSGLGLGKIFASAENPSIIERVMGRRLSPEARAAIMDASFALMAGRSPFFMSNVGEAGRVGSQAYSNAVAMSRKTQEQDAANAEKQAQKDYIENAIADLSPEQQAMARAFPEKFFGAQIEKQFGTIDEPALLKEYAAAKRDGFPGTLADWKRLGSGSNGKSFAPIPYTKPDGTIGYGIPRDDGTLVDVPVPEGSNYLSPFERAKQTSAGTTEGKTVTDQSLAAPSDIQAADQAIDILDQIEKSSNLDMGTGFTSLGNAIPGTPGYDFQNLVNQAKSGAFKVAIQSLRGLGALSNTEGEAATSAITRMDTATSKEAFLAALKDYRAWVELGRKNAVSKLHQNAPPVSGGDSGQSAVPNYNYNPDTGELE